MVELFATEKSARKVSKYIRRSCQKIVNRVPCGSSGMWHKGKGPLNGKISNTERVMQHFRCSTHSQSRFPDSYHAQAAKGSCVKKSKTYLIFYNERKYFEQCWPIASVMLQRLNFSITSNQFYRCNWTLLSHRNIVAAIEKVQVLIT